MDSLLGSIPTDVVSSPLSGSFPDSSKADIDTFLIKSALSGYGEDKVSMSFAEMYKNLSITAKKVIDKLNELLKTTLPNGLQSLKPEEVTAEATAERIVSGATAFFDIFAKQNPNLSEEELLDKFMKTIRGGIQTGYDDAVKTLEALGAFGFNGVREGVEKTRSLIEEKLVAFYEMKKKEFGISSEEKGTSAPTTDGKTDKGLSGNLSVTA